MADQIKPINLKRICFAPLNQGFTLIEIVLTVAVLAILFRVTVPVFLGFQSRSALESAVNTTVGGLRQAQTFARTGSGDGQWGVKMADGAVTVFQGASYATRNATLDETTDIAPAITPTGLTEVVFSKLSGDPTTTGTIILTTQNNEAKSITINAKGTLVY